jgi:hypothetical protein
MRRQGDYGFLIIVKRPDSDIGTRKRKLKSQSS